jgi:hydrogenase-4 component B
MEEGARHRSPTLRWLAEAEARSAAIHRCSQGLLKIRKVEYNELVQLFMAGLAAYTLGMALGLARFGKLPCFLSLAGSLVELAAAVTALFSPSTLAWSLPSGIPYLTYSVRLDPLSAYFLLALSLLAAAVSLYSLGYLRRSAGLFCFFLNLLLLSLTLVFTASNVLFFLIAWELMAVSAYFLVVFDHESVEARRGGLLYLLMSRGGSGMMLIGFLLLAAGAGSRDFALLHGVGQRLAPASGVAAFLLLFLGFGVKAGIIPLHIWLPAAHSVAPSNISALMSGIVIKAGIYGMVRVFFDFYGALPAWAGMSVLAIGVISALLGVLYALMEHDLKRLLAYHSIENIGIVLMGFGASLLFRSFGHEKLAALALVAGLFHTLNHAVFKCLLYIRCARTFRST